MPVSLPGLFNVQQFTDLGVLAVGGRIYTYAPSTTTHKTAYTDQAGAVAHTYTNDGIGGQYIALNARGELPAPLFLSDGGYDIAYKTAAGVTVWTRRAIGSADDGSDTALTSLAASSGSSLVGFLQAGTGAVARTQQEKDRDTVSVKDFGATGDGATNDYAAIMLAINSGAKRIYFPGGKYRCDQTISLSAVRGLALEGDSASLSAGGTGYTGTTELIFDNATSGSNGLVVTDFVGLSISNMLIRMRRGGAGGGKALYLYAGHDYSLTHIKIDLDVGTTGGGIVLGNGSGATATFVGHIQNCKVMVNSLCDGIHANFGTSLTFTACYVIGSYMKFNQLSYCSAISCAVDSSRGYAYLIVGSKAMVFDACGSELCEKGAFYLSTNSSNIDIRAPYGATNNVSSDATIGDLVHIDSSAGVCKGITISNPTSDVPNGSTVQNIYANVNTGFVEVLNTDLGALSLGINGDATWMRDKLTITGYWRKPVTWTPALSVWTNTGSPTITAKYERSGNVVTFWIKVVPATNISCTRVTSSITGFPFTALAYGSCTMSDDNAVSYGVCAVAPTGVIYPQTSGVLTVPLYFVGTAIIA